MGEGQGSRAEAEANDVSSGQEKDRGGSTRAVGQGEERSLRGAEANRGGDAAALVPVTSITFLFGSPHSCTSTCRRGGILTHQL
jgi:hypothetical protein